MDWSRPLMQPSSQAMFLFMYLCYFKVLVQTHPAFSFRLGFAISLAGFVISRGCELGFLLGWVFPRFILVALHLFLLRKGTGLTVTALTVVLYCGPSHYKPPGWSSWCTWTSPACHRVEFPLCLSGPLHLRDLYAHFCLVAYSFSWPRLRPTLIGATWGANELLLVALCGCTRTATRDWLQRPLLADTTF